jgi:hypothetical protein
VVAVAVMISKRKPIGVPEEPPTRPAGRPRPTRPEAGAKR